MADVRRTNYRPRGKRYQFTDNQNREPKFDCEHMDYLVYQSEEGADTHHKHTQGYVRFKDRLYMTVAQDLLGLPNCHMELARGTETDNKAYCTKQETRVDGPHGEFGEFSPLGGQQGHRSDLDEAVSLIKKGGSMKDLAEQFPKAFVINGAGLDRLRVALTRPPPKERDILVTILWGPTATGKTHRTHNHFPDLYVVHGHPRNPWDQYNGEEAILLDEFNYKDWQVTELNAILDKWPHRLCCRYNNKDAYWVDVVIAANTDPLTWYLDCVPPVSGDLLSALFRRMSHVVYVSSKDQDVLFAREAREAGKLSPFLSDNNNLN